MEWRFPYDPTDHPESSTAYEGYVWRVRASEDICYIVDLDELAEYNALDERDVTIISIEPFLDPNIQNTVE